MSPNNCYYKKLKFIEQKIESDIQYFNMKNILDENALKMDAIKAQLRQKQKLINKM